MHPSVLKECSKRMARPLSIIYNRSYTDGIIPDLWLRAFLYLKEKIENSSQIVLIYPDEQKMVYFPHI